MPTRTLKEIQSRFDRVDSVAGDLIALVDGVQVSLGNLGADGVVELNPEGEFIMNQPKPAKGKVYKSMKGPNPTSSVLTEVTAQDGEATSRGEGDEPAGETPGTLDVITGEPITKSPDGESKAELSPARKAAKAGNKEKTSDDDELNSLLDK